MGDDRLIRGVGFSETVRDRLIHFHPLRMKEFKVLQGMIEDRMIPRILKMSLHTETEAAGQALAKIAVTSIDMDTIFDFLASPQGSIEGLSLSANREGDNVPKEFWEELTMNETLDLIHRISAVSKGGPGADPPTSPNDPQSKTPGNSSSSPSTIDPGKSIS